MRCKLRTVIFSIRSVCLTVQTNQHTETSGSRTVTVWIYWTTLNSSKSVHFRLSVDFVVIPLDPYHNDPKFSKLQSVSILSIRSLKHLLMVQIYFFNDFIQSRTVILRFPLMQMSFLASQSVTQKADIVPLKCSRKLIVTERKIGTRKITRIECWKSSLVGEGLCP